MALAAIAYAARCRFCRETVGGLRKQASPVMTAFEWVAAGGVILLIVLALVTAVASPPVTIDVLNYHAPRQLMWLQQGGLGHFFTVNDRQLMMPPLAEVIGLQFLGLTKGDYWMNLPQWAAYVLLSLATGSTVRNMGCSNRISFLAAWLAVCLPMTYLEASNGKNDLQGAMWIMLLVREAVLGRKADSGSVSESAIRAGLIVGLAILTKSTAMIFAPPLAIAGIWGWKRRKHAEMGRGVVIAALMVMVVTAPFFIRNVGWYGPLLGQQVAENGGQQANTEITPAVVVSNALRNAALHLSSPWAGWNRVVDHAVRSAHAHIGMELNDPRCTYWTTTFAGFFPFSCG